MLHGSAFSQRNPAYQPLDVPLPAAEERLYPSLDARVVDHRVLPPPVDAAVAMPSAPIYGVNSYPAQPRSMVSAPPMQNVNAQGYAPLRDDPQAMPAYGAQPGLPMPPPIEPPFIYDHAGPAPSVEEYPQMTTCKALALSARVSLKNWPKMLGIAFLLILFNLLGLLAFWIGLFITLPVTFIVNVYLYHKLVGLHSVSGYSNTNGVYDGNGSNLEQPSSVVQQQVVAYPAQQLQQPQRVHYVQLVPMSMASAPGVMPPSVSAGAPGGPMVMRPSGVQNV